MVRTQVYLTDEEKSCLASTARARGVGQSELIRQAIDELLSRASGLDKVKVLDEVAGIWAKRSDVPDVRELRTGWRRRQTA